jgi:D-inositol-3-phosphate glycosyltransferase
VAVATRVASTCTNDEAVAVCPSAPKPPVAIEVGLLTGGGDRPYAFGLARALVSKGVRLDFIGSDELDRPQLHTSPNLRFLNLRGSQREDAGLAAKIWRISIYYARVMRYAAVARPKIFHILWNNRFLFFDRTLLMAYYKLLGRKIVFTAHNVNQAGRDGQDSLLNRLSLRIQYQLADHIFVHTEKMKSQLVRDFGVRDQRITVIPFGINNTVPDTDLTSHQAKRKLGIKDGERTILFFGRIGPYKGLAYLAAAFQQLAVKSSHYRLIIVGKPKKGAEKYVDTNLEILRRGVARGRVIEKIEFIPDEDTELYFKAADVVVLPYTEVFQSGVLFLGYSFGLPVVASDVGSMHEDVVEGHTGFLCKPCDPTGLAAALEKYFASDLYKHLPERRELIKEFANTRHSWGAISELTQSVYENLLVS